MKQKLKDVTIFGFEIDYASLLARELLSRYSYEVVRFSTTGGEATMLAVRLARAATFRPKNTEI